MKKLMLAILAIGSFTASNAQKAGSILLYGNLGYNSHKTTEDDGIPQSPDVETKTQIWRINPGIGFQFNRHITAGVEFNLRADKTTYDPKPIVSAEEERMRRFEVGPFVRMTMPVGRIFFMYSQFSAHFISEKNTQEFTAGSPDIERTAKGFNIGWFPAVGVNFTPCMALNFSYGRLQYERTTMDLPGTAETVNSDFSFRWANQMNVGVSANLGGMSHGRRMRGHHEPGEETRKMNAYDDDDEDAPKKKKMDDNDE
jgi:hypothetical protein